MRVARRGFSQSVGFFCLVAAGAAEVGLAEFEPVDVAFVAVVEEVPAESKGIMHGPGGMEDSENRIAG